MATAIFSLAASLLFVQFSMADPFMSAVTGTKYLFVFGDSYSSTGFKIAGAKPSTSNPLGNPALPGSTMSGGLTWPGYLATQFNTSLTLTFDFAYVYATVDNSLVTPLKAGVPSISDQVSTWRNEVASKPSYAPWTSEDSLFGVWIGTNDIYGIYSGDGVDTKITKILDRLFTLLGTLYTAGARNFVLLNVAPTYKTPLMKSMGGATLISAITTWNGQLAPRIDKFKTTNAGTNFTLVDTHPAWNVAINDPKTYGANDATCVSCPGAPDATCTKTDGKCLWYNSYHPGIAIQKLVAQAVAAALKGSFF